MNLFVSLKYLVALAEHRHFGRAALACHVTQPALSNALRALEESFGTSIVKRGRSFAGFTDEGERILVSARRILREHELLQQDLHSRIGDPRGALQVGAVPTAMPIAARFVALLQSRHPGIVPTLRSMSSIELEAGLEDLSLDIGLGYVERLDDARSPPRMLPQYGERYFLLRRGGSNGSTLQYGPPIGWGEAAQHALCMLTADMHNRTIVDRAFAEAGVQPQPAIETNSIMTLSISVAAGSVCSVLPGALLSSMPAHRGLLAQALAAPAIDVPMAFMVHDGNRPSRTLEAALALAQDAEWLAQAAEHAGQNLGPDAAGAAG